MKVLLIGYGSIGKRHFDVLSKIPQINVIDLVTQQNVAGKKCFRNLNEVDALQQYDYFVIASATSKHFEQLDYLEKNVQNKLIFCEKPLFESKYDLNIVNNHVFIGYVLRFHPLVETLKELLRHEQIILANAQCGQYLPTWRPDTNYKECYSAHKEEGGGVLLDLSHEIDYVQWLCGEINELKSYQTKISDLEITSDDITMFIGRTTKNILVNISIDYISKITRRKLLIETMENSFELDFILNKLVKKDKSGLEKIYSLSNLERNFMFEKMHLDVITERTNICTFTEGLQVMNTISTIQEQNK